MVGVGAGEGVGGCDAEKSSDEGNDVKAACTPMMIVVTAGVPGL